MVKQVRNFCEHYRWLSIAIIFALFCLSASYKAFKFETTLFKYTADIPLECTDEFTFTAKIDHTNLRHIDGHLLISVLFSPEVSLGVVFGTEVVDGVHGKGFDFIDLIAGLLGIILHVWLLQIVPIGKQVAGWIKWVIQS